MTRRRYKSVKADETKAATNRMDSFVGKRRANKPAKRRKPAAGKATVAKYISEQQEMRKDDDWTDAKPGHFVALFIEAHEMVYNVRADVTGDDWRGACSAAGRILKTHFGGDKDRFVKFIAWVWTEEDRKEKWRRTNGQAGRVLGWRLVFSNKLITEYKVAKTREMA